MAVAVALVTAFVHLANRPTPLWPWFVVAIFVLGATLVPQWLQPVETVWLFIGEKLGWFNSRVILALVFFLVIAPMGLLRRVFGIDPMARRFDRNVSTYRILRPLNAESSKLDMERPF